MNYTNTFQSVFVGDTQPTTIIPHYLKAFGNRCKALILSLIDRVVYWRRKAGKSEDWVWLTEQDIVAAGNFCRNTARRHLKELIEMNVLEIATEEIRRSLRRWATDQAKFYRINFNALETHLAECDYEPRKSEHSSSAKVSDPMRKSEQSNAQKCPIYTYTPHKPNINNNKEACVVVETFSSQEEKTSQTEALASLPDQQELVVNEVKELNEDHSSALGEAGILLNPRLQALATQFTAEEIKKAIAYYRSESAKQPILNPGGWMAKCLENRWYLAVSEAKPEPAAPCHQLYNPENSLTRIEPTSPPADFAEKAGFKHLLEQRKRKKGMQNLLWGKS